jgi:hypothetical protein
MRTLVAVAVLVLLEAVGHAQVTISIGPQGQPLGIGPQGQLLGNGPQGQYLGNLSGSRSDPGSGLNPFLRPGSQFGADSTNNPYGQWGSSYSNNPTTRGPRVVQPYQPTMPPGW